MSSTPNVTISLSPTAQTASKSGEKSRDSLGLEASPQDSAFAKLVDEARHAESTETGNGLPKEEGVAESNPATVPKTINVNIEDLVVRREGRLKLITGEIPISEESLIDFMQEQGFSRAEMAEVLMARQNPETKISGEQPLLTGSWLQMQRLNRAGTSNIGVTGESQLSEVQKSISAEANLQPSAKAVLDSLTSEPTNLAQALANQLAMPQAPAKTSPIVDVIATQEMLAAAMRIAEDAKSEHSGPGLKSLDLSALLARTESSQSGLGGQNMGQETGAGSGFDRGERTLAEAQSASQKPQEFREFLAEHLRRADSLRELSDRLGTMLARQMNAHIARGSWRLEMTLHPAELGSIEVDMEMTERGLEASFRASQGVTRDLLMESMARLKSWFEEGGIDVAYAGLTQDSGAETGGNSTSDESSEQVDGADIIELSDTESGGGAVIDPHRLDIRV